MDLNESNVDIDDRLKKIFKEKDLYDKELDALKKQKQIREVESFVNDDLFRMIRSAVFDGKASVDISSQCIDMDQEILSEFIGKIKGLRYSYISNVRNGTVITVSWR